MDPVCNVPVEVAEYALVLLHGGYGVHHPLQKVTAVLIASLFLLPLHRRVIGRQVAHTVIELAGGVAFPIGAAGDEVPGLHRYAPRPPDSLPHNGTGPAANLVRNLQDAPAAAFHLQHVAKGCFNLQYNYNLCCPSKKPCF